MTRLLTRSFLRFILRAPFSSVSVFLGVLLGVASVTGVHLLGAQVNASLDGLRPPHLERVTHVATRQDLDVHHYAELARRLQEGSLAGVVRLAPLMEGTLADGTRVVATDWLGGGAVGIAAGVRADVEVDLQAAVVRGFDGRAEVCEPLQVSGRTIPVIGTLPASELTDDAPTLFVDLGLGTSLLGVDQPLQAVLLEARSPTQQLADGLELLMPGMSAGLSPPALPLGDGWQVHDVQTELAGFGLARAVLFNVGALGSLSLLVAVLLMYQTCVIWLRRQRDILARLMDIGVPRAALAAGFLCALLLLGGLATAAGLLAGQGLAQALLAQLAVPTASALALTATVVIKALASGVLVCLFGGVVAWYFEWRPRHRRVRGAAWFTALAIAAASGWLLSRTDGLIGVFAVILLVAGLVCWMSLPLLDTGRRFTERLRGSLLVRLALREATWYSGDLALAVAALALALGVSIGVGLMVDSFRREFVAMLDTRLQADLYVTADTSVADAADWLAGQPGVRRVALYGDAEVRVEGQPVSVGYGAFDAAEARRYGYPRALAANEVLASERALQALQRSVGDVATVGGVPLTIVGSFPGFGDAGLRLLLSVDGAARLGFAIDYRRIGIAADDPSSLASALAARHPTWTITNQQIMRGTAIRVFDQTFLITEALTALAMIVAAVALFNALGGMRLNQQATSELLDVLGLNRVERLTIDFTRATTVGTVALLLALPLGLWLGWVLCSEVNPRAFGWRIDLTLAPAAFVTPLVSGAVAVLLAGVLGVPGERRGRLA